MPTEHKFTKLAMDELARKSIEEFHETQKVPVVVLLDDIRSMQNIGSVFRTADAFLIEEIILCGITAQPPHREIQRSALGATESVKWSYFNQAEEAISKYKKEGYIIIAIEQVSESTLLQDFIIKANQKYMLIFGNEVTGVSQTALNICNSVIEIPQGGTKHSLNIAVSAGIVLWEFYSKITGTTL